jgi:hypothetical protein
MMKGYATLLHPTTPAAGSRDEAVSLSSPSAPSLSIIARHPQSIVCTVQHRTSPEVLPNILAVITALKVLQIPIVSCYINLARPSRSRRNSGRIPFRARRLISVHRIPRPRHRIIYYFMILQPTSQRQSSKRFGSLSQHSHLQRETVVKFGGRNGHCP